MGESAFQMGGPTPTIQKPYDPDSEFYRIWLDPNLVHSGALWQDGDTLEAAQIRKLEHHIRAARASGKANVLDIGCGWGALLRRLVDHHRVAHAIGLTLNKNEYTWIRSLKLPGVEVRLESWQDHDPVAPYGAIISIGGFEHFVSPEWSEAEKIEAYRQFFARTRDMLMWRGYLSLQMFAYGSALPRWQARIKDSSVFMAREIFPDTEPPRLAHIAEAIAGYFELIDLQNDRLGYAKTCKEWLENLRIHREQAILLVGTELFERYQAYLNSSYLGFKTGYLDLYRMTLRRVEPKPALRGDRDSSAASRD